MIRLFFIFLSFSSFLFSSHRSPQMALDFQYDDWGSYGKPFDVISASPSTLQSSSSLFDGGFVASIFCSERKEIDYADFSQIDLTDAALDLPVKISAERTASDTAYEDCLAFSEDLGYARRSVGRLLIAAKEFLPMAERVAIEKVDLLNTEIRKARLFELDILKISYAFSELMHKNSKVIGDSIREKNRSLFVNEQLVKLKTDLKKLTDGGCISDIEKRLNVIMGLKFLAEELEMRKDHQQRIITQKNGELRFKRQAQQAREAQIKATKEAQQRIIEMEL